MIQAGTHVHWDRLLADAGYDGELNHRLCHEVLGMRSTVIALNPRNRGRKWPLAPYRRRMKRPENRVGYGQRWQIESSFSRNKRRLGSHLRARCEAAQLRECLLRVLTHNLLILG
jgi:transposase